MSTEDKAIEEFIDITGIVKSVAEQYLARNDYDVENAVNDYYNTEHVEPGSKSEISKNDSILNNNNNKNNKRSSGSLFKSFSDLRGSENHSGNNDNDDNDDDDNMNFFTGGEKSGLAVEDPNKRKTGSGRKLVDDLIEKAQKEADQPDWRQNNKLDDNEDTNIKKKKAFKGTGHSLGSIENSVDSKTVLGENLSSDNSGRGEKVTRTITFWKEGFSIDDGELYKYDDPKNQDYLKQLNMGRAPLSLLKVQMFQDVDVNVVKKLDESYHDHQKLKPRVFGFQGNGQRLGSPIPGEPTTVEEAIAKYENNTNISSVTNPESENKNEVSEDINEEQGDTSIQIRLATGERIIQRFNSTDKIEEIYNFVATKDNNSNRAWGLVTSFPTKPLDDKKSQTIAEAGLKNAVIIQRWN